jgi:uncharacterized MAPEG superfamily protein
MDIMMQMLALSVVLCLVQLVLHVHFAILQRGLKWAFTPRDESVPPLKGLAGRFERAFYNFLETFPLFLAVVFLAASLNRHDNLTNWGVQLYFWARVAYVPVYLAGWPVIRTLIWGASIAGVVMVLVSVL